jgi:hypothetical protein
MPTLKQQRDWEREREKNRKLGGLVKIQIETLVPSKWRFVDQETGNIWKWDVMNNKFVHAETCST